MNKSKVWFTIRDSFWFVPAIYSIIAIFLVLLTHQTDVWLAAELKGDVLKEVLTSRDTAKQLYATLVTAILTMTTLSFSVIMVVLTTYASQFSPRVLQNFMENRFTQHVLGIYSSAFIFALLLLFLVDASGNIISPFVMVIIAIITLAAFIYFTHHSARFLQINSLIETLKDEGTKVIDLLYRKKHTYHKYSSWDKSNILKLKEKEKTIIQAKESGYVQNIHWDDIIRWAHKHDWLIELHVQPGSFVPATLPIMTIWSSKEVKGNVHSLLVIGQERSDVQDFDFAIQKIEEIALRAISPSTNDPHTAMNCINRMGVLLIELGEFYEETPYLTDEKNHLRLIHQPMSFDDYLYKSFYQLRYYGQDDVSIIYNIIDTLYKIALVSKPEIKQKIWQFHFYITDVVEWDTLSDLDRTHLQKAYDRLVKSCKKGGVI